MNSDQLFRSWMADMETVANDVYELFALRRTHRDVAEVFRGNTRLQASGDHLWTWMLLNYVASVLMRIRRLVDSQRGTVNLKQLMHAIASRPDVITRGRRRAILGADAPPFAREMLDREFTNTWVRNRHPENQDQDSVSAEIVEADLRALEEAVDVVTQFANRTIAHRTREVPGDITYSEIDSAFDAIENAFTKYHALLLGRVPLQAEPVPQFNTREVFTFAWIPPADER